MFRLDSHEMIVVREYGPSLQTPRVFRGEGEEGIVQVGQPFAGSEVMQFLVRPGRDDVGAWLVVKMYGGMVPVVHGCRSGNGVRRRQAAALQKKSIHVNELVRVQQHLAHVGP